MDPMWTIKIPVVFSLADFLSAANSFHRNSTFIFIQPADELWIPCALWVWPCGTRL